MRTLLRAIAAAIGLLVLVPFLFLAWHFVELVSGHSRPRLSPRAWLLLLFLAAFTAFATFAMCRLWQLRQSGRRAMVGVLVLVIVLLGGSALHGFPTSPGAFALACLSVVALLLPPARRVCS